MIPIKVIFKSGKSITAWSTNPDEFAQSIANISPPEIAGLDYSWTDNGQMPPELQEVTINLKSGSVLMCEVTKSELTSLAKIEDILGYENSNLIAYARLRKEEDVLDARFAATAAVINNVPDLDIRLYCHKRYLKCKAAYIAALESIVDGIFRRPDE